MLTLLSSADGTTVYTVNGGEKLDLRLEVTADSMRLTHSQSGPNGALYLLWPELLTFVKDKAAVVADEPVKGLRAYEECAAIEFNTEGPWGLELSLQWDEEDDGGRSITASLTLEQPIEGVEMPVSHYLLVGIADIPTAA